MPAAANSVTFLINTFWTVEQIALTKKIPIMVRPTHHKALREPSTKTVSNIGWIRRESAASIDPSMIMKITATDSVPRCGRR